MKQTPVNENKPEQAEADAFKELMTRLLAVPKSEIEEKKHGLENGNKPKSKSAKKVARDERKSAS